MNVRPPPQTLPGARATISLVNDQTTGVAAPALPGPAEANAARRSLLRWLFIAGLLLYLVTTGTNFSSGDSAAELRVAQSLAEHGWVDVPQQKHQLCGGWGCQGTDGRFYATHAIGYSLFLLPFYAGAQGIVRLLHSPNCADGVKEGCVPVQLISWTGCALTATTVALLCLLVLELGYTARRALLVALLYGFATLAWPYARYGFDVTLTALLLLGAYRETLHALGALPTLASPSPCALPSSQYHIAAPGWLSPERRWLRAGGLAALALLVRLPAAAAVLPLGSCVLWAALRPGPARTPRPLAAFGLPLLGALAFTCWYNLARFGSASPFADGHATNSADGLATFPLYSFAALLVSPGEGLLWYSPVLLLLFPCIPAFRRAHPTACILALAIAGFELLPYLPVRDWVGGYSWGPRFLVQSLPLLALPLTALPDVARTARARLLVAAIVALSALIGLAGLLVSYHDRLRLTWGGALPDALQVWDPARSPIIDHLRTLWVYITHPGRATRIPDRGDSFDLWWLTLWRTNGTPPGLTIAIAAALALLALLAAVRTWRAAQRLP